MDAGHRPTTLRKLVLFGLFAALPLVTVPLVWAGAGGGGREASLAAVRAGRPAAKTRPPVIQSVVATTKRVSFRVNRAGGLAVAIRDERGRLVRRLGHFTVAAGSRLVLTWDGARAPAGSVAVVTAAGRTARAPVRGLTRADDPDRQPLRQPG